MGQAYRLEGLKRSVQERLGPLDVCALELREGADNVGAHLPGAREEVGVEARLFGVALGGDAGDEVIVFVEDVGLAREVGGVAVDFPGAG